MKAMLSQPMAGKTDEEIRATREKAIAVLKEKGYEIVNTLFTDEWYSKESMEEIVKSVNRQEEGGEGRADEFILKYAEVQHG